MFFGKLVERFSEVVAPVATKEHELYVPPTPHHPAPPAPAPS